MIPSTGYAYWMFGALAKENGEVLMSADGTRTYFDKPNVIEALQFWRDLAVKDKVMPEGDNFDHEFNELLEDRFLMGSPADVADQLNVLFGREGTRLDDVVFGPCLDLALEQFLQQFDGQVALGHPPDFSQEFIGEDGDIGAAEAGRREEVDDLI